jgi:hypothetical protein
MYAEYVCLQLKPESVISTLDIAKFVNSVVPVVYSATERLYAARRLQSGETWEPRPWDVQQDSFSLPEAEMFEITVELPGDGIEEMEKMAHDKKVLLMLGASGDAEAAVEYCRLVLGIKNESICGAV